MMCGASTSCGAPPSTVTCLEPGRTAAYGRLVTRLLRHGVGECSGGTAASLRTSGVDTRHLRAAIEVARHGSFTRAAKELYMAQSTLSRQVQTLERDLGTDLFVRGLPSITLTRAGKAFIPEAERVLEAIERAQAAVAAS